MEPYYLKFLKLNQIIKDEIIHKRIDKRMEVSMTNEEVAIMLTKHREEISSSKRRLEDLEEQNKAMQELVLSVKELAVNMKNMIEEQQSQGKRLAELEKEPSARLTQIKTAIITALASCIITAAVGTVLMLMK